MRTSTVYAILPNIRSIHNVASIFRTADGAGITKLYLTGITPGPLDAFGRPLQAFTKVSLGAERSVAWERAKSLTALVKKLQRNGCRVVAIEQDKRSAPLEAYRAKSGEVAFVVGEETKGLPPAVLTLCDAILEIPMRGTKESLNVSVAFGIAAYALTKSYT